MTDNQDQFMNLLFNPGESVCVSHNKFAYHSISQDELSKDSILLISENEIVNPQSVSFTDISLISLNPITGYRKDTNCTAYRSFLVEADDMGLEEQRQYFEKDLCLPASSVTFSGNRSYHYVITLDHDLASAVYYRYIAQWILNICSQADQMTKNPSRSTRFPDNVRDGGAKQELIYLGSRISQETLFKWLGKWEKHKPIIHRPSVANRHGDFQKSIPPWVQDALMAGITADRNITWFKHACSCFKNGWSLEDLIQELEPYFLPEHDFSKNEWLGILKSAYQRVARDDGGAT